VERTRTLNYGDASECNDDLRYTKTVYIPYCPIPCEVNDWSKWSECTAKCGAAMKRRTRSIKTSPQYGASDYCPYLVDTKPCDYEHCPTDCVISEWDEWSPCSATCKGYHDQANPYKTKQRHILKEATYNGYACTNYVLTASTDCNVHACPIHCELYDWSRWSECDTYCDLGQKNRTREIKVAPSYGGRPCQPLAEYALCENEPCQQKCELSVWSYWSGCSVSCGYGERKRHRALINYESDPAYCPPVEKTEQCGDTDCCPVDCRFSYSKWSECNEDGYRRRNIIIKTRDSCYGKKCPTCTVERDDCEPPQKPDECWLESCLESETK